MEHSIVIFTRSFDLQPRIILGAIRRYAETRRWNVSVVEIHGDEGRDCDIVGVSVGEDMRCVFARLKPDGVLFISCHSARLAARVPKSIPVVFVDPDVDVPNRPAVICDNVAVCAVALKELERSRRRDYVFAPWPERRLWSERRERAFRRDVLARGYRYHRLAPSDYAGQLKNMPLPCCIFAVNDFVAAKVLSAARSLGLAVPEDIMLVGVDNDPQICETQPTTFSSIELDFKSAGEIGARKLDSLLGGSPLRGPEMFGAIRLERRASTCLFSRVDRRVKTAVEFIREHVGEALTPGRVAERLGCSRNLADLIFKQSRGRTVHAEILLARVEKVKALLLDDRIDHSLIDGLCGFSSMADLRRVFKRLTGVSPRAWLKSPCGRA